jgi:hypothetical protein
MTDPQLEATLRKELSCTTVADLPEKQFVNYNEVQELARTNNLSISAPHSPKLARLFGSRREVGIYFFLGLAPLLICGAIIFLAIATFRFVSLWGIPLVLLGVILAAPPLSRGFGFLLALAAWAGFIYFAFHSFTPAVLLGSFAVANLCSRLARLLCYSIIKESALSSEVAFLWLLSHDALIVERRL